MTWGWLSWVLLILAPIALLVAAVILVGNARRLDSIHRRLVRVRVALERALVKRASDALALAEADLLAQESAEDLRSAARSSLASADTPIVADGLSGEVADSDERYVVESRLSAAIRDVLLSERAKSLQDDPFGSQLLERLSASNYKVQMLRSVHNQDVTLALEMRAKPLIRTFRLSGNTPVPVYADFDDEI